MENEKLIREAVYEIFKAIRNSSELPHEVPPASYKYEIATPSGLPIDVFITCMEDKEANVYSVYCQSGLYMSKEVFGENLDKSLDRAIWSLLVCKFGGTEPLPNPFYKID